MSFEDVKVKNERKYEDWKVEKVKVVDRED